MRLKAKYFPKSGLISPGLISVRISDELTPNKSTIYLEHNIPSQPLWTEPGSGGKISPRPHPSGAISTDYSKRIFDRVSAA